MVQTEIQSWVETICLQAPGSPVPELSHLLRKDGDLIRIRHREVIESPDQCSFNGIGKGVPKCVGQRQKCVTEQVGIASK